jgi:hypothetical protein
MTSEARALYAIFLAVYGESDTPSREAGDEAIAVAEAQIPEDAA